MQIIHLEPRARCYSCPAYIHSESTDNLTIENLKVHNDFYTCDDIDSEIAYIDQMVDLFVGAQLEIIERETLLSNYDSTQRQSLVILEHAGGGVTGSDSSSSSAKSLIVQKQPKSSNSDNFLKSHRELQESYDQEKLALIMQGLSVTGNLLPLKFSLPTNLNEAKKRKRSRMMQRIIRKKEKLTFTAYRYPKTVDIHSLRSTAIRLLVNLCPYNN